MLDCRNVVITAVPKDPVFEVYLVSTCFQKILLSYISYVVSTWFFSLPPLKHHLGKRYMFPPPNRLFAWFVSADRLGWLHSVPAEFGKLNVCGVSEVLWFPGWLVEVFLKISLY